MISAMYSLPNLGRPRLPEGDVDLLQVVAALFGDLGYAGHRPQVGDVLPQGQFAVHQEPVHLPAVVAVHHALGQLFEALRVFGGPPVAQVSFGVVERPHAVEGVGDLVGDDHADAPQVLLGSGIGVVEGRLQDAGHQCDAVGQGIVVGVYRLGCVKPARLVYGFVLGGELGIPYGAMGLQDVVDEEASFLGPFERELIGVLGPLVGDTDERRYGLQLI